MAAWAFRKTVWGFECASCRADKAVAIVIFQQAWKVVLRVFARRNAEHGAVRIDARQSMRPDSRAGRREYLATAAAALGHWGRSQPLKAQRLLPVIDVERCQSAGLGMNSIWLLGAGVARPCALDAAVVDFGKAVIRHCLANQAAACCAGLASLTQTECLEPVAARANS